MEISDSLKKLIAEQLPDFGFTAFHLFHEDGVGYIVIRRTRNLIMQNWHIFERIFKNNLKLEQLYIMSYEEISAEQLEEIKSIALMNWEADYE